MARSGWPAPRPLPPVGTIFAIEASTHHAEMAPFNITQAGLTDRVDLHTGPALEVLPKFTGPFDLIFIDADKPNDPAYSDWSLKLSRPGTVIIADNVVRGCAVADPCSTDPSVIGMRDFVQRIADHPQLEAMAMQTAGEKGSEGFVMAVFSG